MNVDMSMRNDDITYIDCWLTTLPSTHIHRPSTAWSVIPIHHIPDVVCNNGNLLRRYPYKTWNVEIMQKKEDNNGIKV